MSLPSDSTAPEPNALLSAASQSRTARRAIQMSFVSLTFSGVFAIPPLVGILFLLTGREGETILGRLGYDQITGAIGAIWLPCHALGLLTGALAFCSALISLAILNTQEGGRQRLMGAISLAIACALLAFHGCLLLLLILAGISGY